MPDREDLERRLWRSMPWDAGIMQPTPEQDERDEAAEAETAAKTGKEGGNE